MKFIERMFKHRAGIANPGPQTAMKGHPSIEGILQYRPVLLKSKKWVVVNNRVGIVGDLTEIGTVRVDFVDQSGFTIASEQVPVGNIRLARYMEIPEPRRPADQHIAAGLGYF